MLHCVRRTIVFVKVEIRAITVGSCCAGIESVEKLVSWIVHVTKVRQCRNTRRPRVRRPRIWMIPARGKRRGIRIVWVFRVNCVSACAVEGSEASKRSQRTESHLGDLRGRVDLFGVGISQVSLVMGISLYEAAHSAGGARKCARRICTCAEFRGSAYFRIRAHQWVSSDRRSRYRQCCKDNTALDALARRHNWQSS